MAYKEGDDGYIECPNCDIFYNTDGNDSCPLCVVDDLAFDLLEACKLIERIADFESGEITPEEWQQHVEPFSKQNQVSMICIVDAIKAIANEAIAKAEADL